MPIVSLCDTLCHIHVKHFSPLHNYRILFMYKKRAHIHFMGIGGIGMSGIATILRAQGYIVSGCDTDINQKSIHLLSSQGCTIQQGNYGPVCQQKDINVLVYSSAISPNNPEIIAATQRAIPIIPRALMLAELMRTKYSIAIAGAHGKTTTTSFISHILLEAAYDPTVIIGGILKTISHNARIGNGDFLVAEADESDRSFLYLHPTIAVVTNIDNEHLDTYKDLNDIKETFNQFLRNIPFYGTAIVCADDPHISSLLPIPHVKTITYGLHRSTATIVGTDIALFPDKSSFTLVCQDTHETYGPITVAMPGIHNVLNALAAIAVARDIEIPMNTITQALATFAGVERRFTYRGTYQGATIFDDYGHHPTELHHVFTIAKARSKGKTIVVFQPHRYSRMHLLWDDFVSFFVHHPVDLLIITDVYGANEQAIANITGENLVKAIKAQAPDQSILYVPADQDWMLVEEKLASHSHENDLILTVGAGSIYKLGIRISTPQPLQR